MMKTPDIQLPGRKNGFALISAILLLLFAMTLGLLIITLARQDLRMNRAVEEQEAARYLAESGIQYGLHLCDGYLSTPENTVVMDGQLYTQDLSTGEFRLQIDVDYTSETVDVTTGSEEDGTALTETHTLYSINSITLISKGTTNDGTMSQANAEILGSLVTIEIFK